MENWLKITNPDQNPRRSRPNAWYSSENRLSQLSHAPCVLLELMTLRLTGTTSQLASRSLAVCWLAVSFACVTASEVRRGNWFVRSLAVPQLVVS